MSEPLANNTSVRAVLPLVAIVGRPNVGKSTVFNRLVGWKRSIVSDEPGITRDRIYGVLEWSGVGFEVVDTGGIIPGEESEIPNKISSRLESRSRPSSLLLLIVDARSGRTPADEELASLLRKAGKPVFLIVNKVDSDKQMSDGGEFRNLASKAVSGFRRARTRIHRAPR